MPVQTVRMVSVKDFEAGAHDSVLNVISLTAGPLKSFTGKKTKFTYLEFIDFALLLEQYYLLVPVDEKMSVWYD